MENSVILEEILEELTENAKHISSSSLEKFANEIIKARHIFVAGAGRSGFVARGFANRLMHLGLEVFFVGEPTTPAIEKKDLLEELYPHISKFIFGGFRMMVEHCYGIYNFIYKMSGRMKVEIQPRGKALYKRLKKIMDGEQPDVIVCTHPMCVKAIASYKEKTGLKTPLVTCITDISMHPEWTAPQTDIYLVPTQEIKRHLMKEGTRAEDILVTGIPVRQQFLDADYRQKRERNRTRRVLIMGGGLGLMPDLKELLEKLHSMQGVESVVITGKNHKMYEEWVNRYEDVEVLGYTENISRYMRGADLVITKAGGITLFEILHSQVPLFVIHPFLEQEMNNARYAAEKGFAKVIWGRREDYIPELEKLLSDEKMMEEMTGNVRRACKEMIEVSLDEAVGIMEERMTA